MGIFSDLFGGKSETKKEEKNLPWISLKSLEQLKEIQEKSKIKPQVIFKHSTTCGISRMVLNMFTANYEINEVLLDLYYLDLHAHREVSDEVGVHFQVMHQSPQVLIVKNGVAVFHASHGAISKVNLNQFI